MQDSDLVFNLAKSHDILAETEESVEPTSESLRVEYVNKYNQLT